MSAGEPTGVGKKFNPTTIFFTGLVLGLLGGGLIGLFSMQVERSHYSKKLEGFTVVIDNYKDQVSDLEALLKKKDTSVVPMINKLRPQLDNSIAEEISKAIIKYSQEYRIPPQFVVHIINRESNFNTLAVSSAGAVGLMQVLPKYHKKEMAEMGISDNGLYHIDHNIRLGCRILRSYYNETGSIEKALTKYVGGNHKTYISDILEGFANEMIPKKEPQKKE